MCGIAGYLTTDPTRVRPEALQKMARMLMLEIESRGRDAAGYAYVSLKDKSVYLAKAPVPASEFLRIEGHILTRPGIKKMPRGMILHTRAATQGSPQENMNNHPIYSKASGLCMIHNGWISNDDQLVQRHGLSQDAEVDSEVYLRLIEKYYLEHPHEPVESGIKEATEQVFGSVAAAMIQAGRTDTLWLWRDAGQLAFARTDWGFVFASTKDALLRAIMGTCSAFDLGSLEVSEPDKGTLFTLTSNGKVKSGKVDAADWHKLPDHLSGRVYRTYVNGKLTNVRRARDNRGTKVVSTYGGYTNRDIPEDWEDYYGEMGEYGWFNRAKVEQDQRNSGNVNNGASDTKRVYHSSGAVSSTADARHQQRILLPDFSTSGSGKKDDSEEGSTDQGGDKEGHKEGLPLVSQSVRAALFAARDKEREKDCYCQVNYCCLRCTERGEYLGVSKKVIEDTAEAEQRYN